MGQHPIFWTFFWANLGRPHFLTVIDQHQGLILPRSTDVHGILRGALENAVSEFDKRSYLQLLSKTAIKIHVPEVSSHYCLVTRLDGEVHEMIKMYNRKNHGRKLIPCNFEKDSSLSVDCLNPDYQKGFWELLNAAREKFPPQGIKEFSEAYRKLLLSERINIKRS
jgi:hypothetical protein